MKVTVKKARDYLRLNTALEKELKDIQSKEKPTRLSDRSRRIMIRYYSLSLLNWKRR